MSRKAIQPLECEQFGYKKWRCPEMALVAFLEHPVFIGLNEVQKSRISIRDGFLDKRRKTPT
jgi:hypothetical protein